jgi:hypothetical protein
MLILMAFFPAAVCQHRRSSRSHHFEFGSNDFGGDPDFLGRRKGDRGVEEVLMR